MQTTREILHMILYICTALGIPSIFSISVWCLKKCKEYTNSLEILKKAVQAQMRGGLLDKYHLYMTRDYITDEEMQQWESEYQAYHALGQNGVMDARRDDLIHLKSKKYHN